MKDRIRQLMESQHMTQQVFADCIGTTPATLSGIFNDRTRPTLNIAEAIIKKFPDISTDWLLFGKGDMWRHDATPNDQPEHGANHHGQQQAVDQNLSFSFEPTPPSASSQRQLATPTNQGANSVRNTPLEQPTDFMNNLNKSPRRVTEIRIYYDDQTYETFTPA